LRMRGNLTPMRVYFDLRVEAWLAACISEHVFYRFVAISREV
jgi:hypothetical protein